MEIVPAESLKPVFDALSTWSKHILRVLAVLIFAFPSTSASFTLTNVGGLLSPLLATVSSNSTNNLAADAYRMQ